MSVVYPRVARDVKKKVGIGTDPPRKTGQETA
jgi:hypothetical protein